MFNLRFFMLDLQWYSRNNNFFIYTSNIKNLKSIFVSGTTSPIWKNLFVFDSPFIEEGYRIHIVKHNATINRSQAVCEIMWEYLVSFNIFITIKCLHHNTYFSWFFNKMIEIEMHGTQIVRHFIVIYYNVVCELSKPEYWMW